MIVQGWSFSGLWTPGHCGIPGNDLADALAKGGVQSQPCQHTRATKSWIFAAIQKQQLEDWCHKTPKDRQFPLPPSTTFPEALKKLSLASTKALFQLQTLRSTSKQTARDLRVRPAAIVQARPDGMLALSRYPA